MKEIYHTTSPLRVSEEPNDQDIVRSLLKLLGLLDDDRRTLQEQMDVVDRKIEAVNLLLDSPTESKPKIKADRIPPDTVVESPTADLSEIDVPNDDDGPVSGVVTAADIAHCRTQREASYVIAKMNGGAIDLNTAAVVIKSAELSKGKVSTVVSSLHNFMTHSDDWSYAGPSRFELVTDRESVLEALSMTDSGDEESSEANSVEGDSMMAQTVDATVA